MSQISTAGSQVSTSAAIESVLAAQQSSTQSKVAYAVAAKASQAHQAAGDAALALLDAAAPKGVAEGKGLSFDAVG